MDTAKVKEQLSDHNKLLEEANSKRAVIVRSAEKDYYIACKKSKEFKQALLEDLRKRAWDYVKEDAPFTRCGGKEYFDSIWLIDDGVTIRWDADHPNDIVDIDITFEELYNS